MPVLPFKFTANYLIENLSNTGRTRKQILSFAIDAAIVAFCVWGAFSLRLGQPYSNFSNIWHLMVLLPPVTVFIFAGLGVYRWVVRASSSREYEQLIKGGLASSMVLLLALFLLPVAFAPRSVFLIYGVLLAISVIGVRGIWAKIHRRKVENSGKPVAIYGGGVAGRQLVSLMRLSNEFNPEFFLDDSYALIGSTIAGLPVFNPAHSSVSQQLKVHAIEEIIFAIPSIQGERYSKLLKSVELLGVPIKTIPSVTEIVSGKSSPDEVRELNLEDLLGRTPVQPDPSLLSKNIRGKRVLVTGAGGSIGSELCRQIASLYPDSLVMLDNSEPSLYYIEQELLANNLFNDISIHSKLGSVTDLARLSEVFNEYRPESVYHAAAYKHVPMVEQNPLEAIKTNVFGTNNLVLTAEKYKVDTFVFISTDKAVRPTNIMGATKRLSEIVLNTYAEKVDQKTKYSMVRFGNVLGSSGSVIPKFTQQIMTDGPVTVTHREMTRYFMTTSEAVSLVIQAGAMSSGGEVYLLDMGRPVKIWDLATAMIKLQRKNPVEKGGVNSASDIEIVEVGARPGEKLYEELLITLSNASPTAHPKIFKANESNKIGVECLERRLSELGSLIKDGGSREILVELLESYQVGYSQFECDKPVHERTHDHNSFTQ